MNIKELSPKDVEAFKELSMTYGTIFNSLNWLSIFGNKVTIYGIYNRGNNLVGGFTAYKERQFGLSIYRNPPFTPSIGPFIKIDNVKPVSIMHCWKDVLACLAEFLSNRYSIITISLDRNISDMQPFIWKKFKVVPGYTYLIPLGSSLDKIWNNLSNERRKNINKARNDGLYVNKTTNYEIIKTLYSKTFLRQDKKINELYVNKILFDFANNQNSFAFVTYRDKDPIACSFCIHDRYTAYYLIGGYDTEKKHHGAGTLSMWEAIKYAQGLGLGYFDFEGSMVPQIERYFREFGGHLIPYFTINKARLPIEILLKFFKRELF